MSWQRATCSKHTSGIKTAALREALMLIPLADVPRWYAERKHKDTVAISHGADTLTWEQLERGANRRARAFAARGVKPGDFVAIGLPNSNAFFETTFAVWKCGATPTSLSWRLPRGEAAAVLEILKPALVVGGEADWNAPNSVPADFTPEGMSDEPLNSPVARYWKAMTSGGSTGRPKVILDHGPAVVETSAEQMLGIPRDVSLLNPGPLYHNAPFILSHMGLFAGGRVTGMVKFDAEEALRLIAAHRVQWVNFVPTMMHRIWSLPEKIYELYGGTERQGATVISGVEWLAHKGSVGKIGETARLRIIGEDGNDVAPGQTGEIYFLPSDGPGTTYHYLGAEPKRRPDGWESLGDIGRLDADGYLYLGDRLADMILRGGANIYPAEVEAAVMAHPHVRSCVAVGLPDPEFGQRVHAILELAGDAEAQSVIDGMGGFLADQLSRYKHPESFEIVAVGPRDDSGKVRRTLLRDERAAWLKEGRAFRIVPSRGPAKQVE